MATGFRGASAGDIPATFPLVFSDRVNDASASGVYVPEIHLILDFQGPLDRPRLGRALRLLLDAEPVLGCRLEDRPFRPRWLRLGDEDLDAAELMAEAPGGEDGREEALQAFFGDFLDSAQGPQIRALLLPGPGSDRLAVKINHRVCDAGGFKEVLYRLAGIYRSLASDPDHLPEPRAGSRSLGQVYGRFSLGGLWKILWRGLAEIWAMMRPFRSLQVPSGRTDGEGGPRLILRHLSPERVMRMRDWAAARGATVNDVLVTATLRALARQTGWEGETALRLVGTVDLRRHLPGRRAGALCQLTGMYGVSLGREFPRDFEATLRRVKGQVDAQKTGHFGLGIFLVMAALYKPYPWFLVKRMMPGFWKVGLWDGNLPPGFTNLGAVDPAEADFGAPELESAAMVIPATHAPWFGVGVSGHKGALTLSAGVWPGAIAPEWVEELFFLVEEELPRA